MTTKWAVALWLTVFVFFTAGTAAAQVNPPMTVGTVVGQNALATAVSGGLSSFQYKKERAQSGVSIQPPLYADPRTLRWRMAFGRLFVYYATAHPVRTSDWFHRFSPEEVFTNNRLSEADVGNGEMAGSFFAGKLGGPLSAIRDSNEVGVLPFAVVRRCDFAPLSQDSMRFWCLHNAPVKFRNTTGDLNSRAEVAFEQKGPNDRWRLDVWDYHGKRTSELGSWAWRHWSYVESIEPAFTEPFHAFTKGTDYYFVTESGRVYVSHRPTVGSRKTEAVWVDGDWPIRAIITDAERDRTYLFGRKLEGKQAHFFYFELSDKPVPTSFDPESLKPVEAEGNLGTVLRYAQLIGYPAR